MGAWDSIDSITWHCSNGRITPQSVDSFMLKGTIHYLSAGKSRGDLKLVVVSTLYFFETQGNQLISLTFWPLLSAPILCLKRRMIYYIVTDEVFRYHIRNKRLIRDYWCLQTQSFYVTSFFMFTNTHLHVTSQHHDITSTLIAIQCNSLCISCRFLKTGGLVDPIGVLQTPIRQMQVIP